MVKGSLVFDADSLPDAKTGVGARSDRDEPKLCPDHSRDVPHGASERAKAYQEQISRLNNPQRPLPAGMAVSLENPLTGRNVAFDDCRESDGTMIEAKGRKPSMSTTPRISRPRKTWPPRWRRSTFCRGRRNAREQLFARLIARLRVRERRRHAKHEGRPLGSSYQAARTLIRPRFAGPPSPISGRRERQFRGPHDLPLSLRDQPHPRVGRVRLRHRGL